MGEVTVFINHKENEENSKIPTEEDNDQLNWEITISINSITFTSDRADVTSLGGVEWLKNVSKKAKIAYLKVNHITIPNALQYNHDLSKFVANHIKAQGYLDRVQVNLKKMSYYKLKSAVYKMAQCTMFSTMLLRTKILPLTIRHQWKRKARHNNPKGYNIK